MRLKKQRRRTPFKVLLEITINQLGGEVILNLMLTLMVAAGGTAPQVEITVKDRGTIVVQLRPDEAPITCAHFLSMVKSGYYDGAAFNRVD